MALFDGSSAAHAQAMDAQYGLQRHVYDLTRKYYLLGGDRLIDANTADHDGDIQMRDSTPVRATSRPRR